MKLFCFFRDAMSALSVFDPRKLSSMFKLLICHVVKTIPSRHSLPGYCGIDRAAKTLLGEETITEVMITEDTHCQFMVKYP